MQAHRTKRNQLAKLVRLSNAILKLTGDVDWHWLLVLSPGLVGLALVQVLLPFLVFRDPF